MRRAVSIRGSVTWLVVAAALLAVPVAATAQALAAQRTLIEARYPRIRWVEPASLTRWLRDDSSVVLLDAREPSEFRVSHLRGARRVDPDLEDVSSLELPAGARVVIYCSVGWRSGILADRFRRAGHADVYNLDGGIFRWANEGRAMVDSSGPARTVHPYDSTWGLMLDEERRAAIPSP